MSRLVTCVCMLLLVCSITPAFADEGMWTLDNFPLAKVNRAFGLKLDQAWVDRIRLGSVRLTSGCSASLVSPQGLVMTNHHCVVDCVQNFSRSGPDLVQQGFFTTRRDQERVCPGMSAEILQEITDVTRRIAAVTDKGGSGTFIHARDSEIAAIEAACQGKDQDKRCEVVSLYQGGQYKLYRYQRFNDVRLVFAPEFNTAFFGGDPDNFNFPRYDLDAAFLRLYVNGKAEPTPQHLQWRTTPLQAGEPVFVAGNPGSTRRLYTTDQMAFMRDYYLPWRLATLSELRGRLLTFSALDAKQALMAADALFGVEKSFKAYTGERQALVDANVFGKQAAAESALKARIAANPALAQLVGSSWQDIATAEALYRGSYLRYQYLEAGAGGGSELFSAARILVRAAAERLLPDSERLPAYSSARLPGLEQQLFADAPAQLPLEKLQLEFWLSKTREYLTADDPLTKLVLGKQSPEVLAQQLVDGSKLGDPAERRRLYEGGTAAIEASSDPLILFARRIDGESRLLRKNYNETVSGPLAKAQEQIAKARFELLGDSVYPDATFTLRLSYGSVQGWTEPSGRTVEPFTRFSGLYQRATDALPFKLTERWLATRDQLNPDTIFDVSTNNDIIGGNSGSPLLDKEGQVVGAIFDGNIHSLGGDYVFDANMNRAVAVAVTAISEALEKVYMLPVLLAELRGRQAASP